MSENPQMNKTGPNFFIPFNYVTEMPNEKCEVGGDSMMVATNRAK